MATNFALQGQQAAGSQSYIGWLSCGVLLGIVGPIFAHLMTPVPPPDVLKQGPTDSTDLQVFVGAYIGANKSIRVKAAWIGFALSFVFYGAGCVACATLGIGLGTVGTM